MRSLEALNWQEHTLETVRHRAGAVGSGLADSTRSPRASPNSRAEDSAARSPQAAGVSTRHQAIHVELDRFVVVQNDKGYIAN